MDEALLLRLLSRCEVRRLSAGTDLLQPGQPNDSLYILLKGELMVYLSAEITPGQGIPIHGGVPPSGVKPWAQHRRSRC